MLMFLRHHSHRLIKIVFVLIVILAGWWYHLLIASLARPTLTKVETRVSHVVPAALASNTMQYSKLGIEAPLTISASTSPLRQSDWNAIRTSLEHGVSLSFDESSFATASLVFVTGHSSDTYPHPYSSIFAGLGQASIGDDVAINVEGTVYQFKVTETHLINPTDAKAFLAFKPAGEHVQRAVLVTCWPPLTTKMRLAIVTERNL